MRSNRAQPGNADYAKGWERFLEVAACLDARRVVVYGLEQRKINALRSLQSLRGRIQPLVVPVAAGVKPVALSIPTASCMHLLFIRHPSAFFECGEWGKVVHQFCREAA
ncbi:MAG TPA: hypothetical protein VFM98_02595 [Ramlibacter sp.]|uniref:hypothetical protein n=1 Tax=Ramlibacter sp. TaxID=1917967 RepID=UPI002D7EF675|nr:hypothetical protein [Ramlibacter sp.]HET8744465.1 hypothetical protein [Ramlibacter sp.]